MVAFYMFNSYIIIGMIYGFWFMLIGFKKTPARNSGIPFRLLIFPCLAISWPYLFWKRMIPARSSRLSVGKSEEQLRTYEVLLRSGHALTWVILPIIIFLIIFFSLLKRP